ncbi:MAG: A24 family peptidase [Alphaproteobacteria bacterium]|nr:A24 family peptidase [Alphaproteobacteria bacterium]
MDTLAPTTLFLILAAPFVGSFLCVLALRLPAGQDVVRGRSRCPSCHQALAVRDLVPVFSWLVARGRCRFCDARIDPIYPIMELAALGVVLWAMLVVDEGVLLVTVLLGWALLALAAMDVRSLFLSDALTLPLIPAGLAACLWLEPDAIWEHALASLAAAGILAGLARAYRHARGRDGLGYGDVKLFAAAGAWTGAMGLGTVLLWAVVVNVLLLVAERLAGQQVSAETRVPIGTGLAVGLWLTWLYGPLSIL